MPEDAPDIKTRKRVSGWSKYALGAIETLMAFRRVLCLVLSLLFFGGLWAGCAASAVPETPNEDDEGASSGTGGQGGKGGAGGAGGQAVLPCGIDCSTIDTGNPCKSSVCDEETLKCTIVSAENGTGCDDGLFCTTNDACSEGVCIGGPPNNCELTVPQCQLVVCDELKKSCVITPAADGSSCSGDNPCLINNKCENGLCIGQEKDCFFAPVPNECFVASCNPTTGLCEPTAGNEGKPCVDNTDLCTVEKSCSAGACIGGVAKDCSALDQGCQAGLCDPTSGQCVSTPIPDGAPCNDHNGCTNGELCTAGQCGGGTVTQQCIDADQCCASGCDDTNDSDCVLKILLLGDDVQDTLQKPDWKTYRDALQSAGVIWSEHNLDNKPFPTAMELNQYNTVILFDQSYALYGDPQCQILADWLQGASGRNMFVTGGDLMWDFAHGPINQGERNLYSLWGATYGGSLYISSNDGKINGVMGDPISDPFVAPNGLKLNSQLKFAGDYANEMMGPATHIGLFDATSGTGLGKSAMSRYATAGYKVVWLGVNFHDGLDNQTERNALMSQVLTYFTN